MSGGDCPGAGSAHSGGQPLRPLALRGETAAHHVFPGYGGERGLSGLLLQDHLPRHPQRVVGSPTTHLSEGGLWQAGHRFVLKFLPVSYTHLRAHETKANLVCRLLLEQKKTQRHLIAGLRYTIEKKQRGQRKGGGSRKT